MKKIILLTLIGLVLVSCKKEKDEPYQFKTWEFVWLNCYNDIKPVVKDKKLKRNWEFNPYYGDRTGEYERMSMHELLRCDQKDRLFLSYTMINSPESSPYRWFWDDLRDTINDRLQFLATDIIKENGELDRDMLDAKDFYVTVKGSPNEPNVFVGDTIAYIPNACIESARRQIDSLWALEKYDEIYELFHTAFELRRCTGAEYRALVARGEN